MGPKTTAAPKKAVKAAAAPAKAPKVANPLFVSRPKNLRVGGDIRVSVLP